MASIVERRGRFCVVYSYKDKNGKRRQKWETYKTMSEAKKRKKEIEYRADIGQMIVPHCKTVKELLEEYVNLYGKEAWALSTYSSNVSMINNYIIPIIGGDKLENINTRFIEKYYQRLLRTPAVINPATGKRQSEYVTPATIRDIHKLLRNCFQQAVKWELMAKNPVIYATVPKYKSAKREIWTAETLMHALEVCEDDRLKLALNLAFSCSLRMGEMLGLTWDCVDISEEAIVESRAFIYVDKEVQRVDKAAIQELRGKDVILVFPEESKKNKTVRVLKLPKTESSIRKVFLPKSVAEMLVEWKKGQDKIKETLGDEYMDYNLVMATPFGLPIGTIRISIALNDLIREHDLPPVVFHSLRHTSVTYKLKLNGGDIKAVQGDSGHSQINMVTDVYSHIIDDDRRKNVEYTRSLLNLGRMLEKHHQSKVVILIDEYDTPIQQGHSRSFYNEVITFMRNFMSGGLKDNPSLAFGVLTGILRVSKENLFSGLNNPIVNSVLDEKYSKYFGFTVDEVNTMAAYYGQEAKLEELREWYDGYRFGSTEIYNPWSVANYFYNNCQVKPYWTNTSDNDIIREIMISLTPDIAENLFALLQGQTVQASLNMDVIYPRITDGTDTIFGFLLLAGYLKPVSDAVETEFGTFMELALPNKEIRRVYNTEILSWLRGTVDGNVMAGLEKALYLNDGKKLQEFLRKYMITCISCFDGAAEGRTRSGGPWLCADRSGTETFYYTYIY